MRYFNNEDPIDKIAREAFNIEAGREYYKNGLFILDKAPLYPLFSVGGGVQTSIKSNMGFIFMPASCIAEFANKFYNKMEQLSNHYKSITKTDHLLSYSALETYNDHFIVLKAKHVFNDNTNVNHTLSNNNHYKRRVVVNDHDIKLEKFIGTARFTWIIYTIDQFISDIINFNNRKLPLSCQLVSILYDPDKLLDLRDGEQHISNITFRDFKVCKSLINVCSYGEINEALIKSLSATTAVYSISNYEKQNFAREVSLYLPKPEYMPGWQQYHGFTLTFCEKRRGAFEIIKHLGNRLMYQQTQYLPIVKINQPIYEVSRDNIIINNVNIFNTNMVDGVEVSNDACINCTTPLYDDIYVVCPNKSKNIGRAICAVCMHCKFRNGSPDYNEGSVLYSSNEIIARVKYPRTVEHVIKNIEVDNLVKDILLQSFQPIYIDYTGGCENIYFGRDVNAARYIGINADINSFVLYIYDANCILRRSIGELVDYLAKRKIFRYNLIHHK